MTKKRYRELLRDAKWKEKRQEVLARDGNKCTKCGEKKRLQVHHTYYEARKKPWNYPLECFLTLCDKCHRAEHKGKRASWFMRGANLIEARTATGILYKKRIKNNDKKSTRLRSKKD